MLALRALHDACVHLWHNAAGATQMLQVLDKMEYDHQLIVGVAAYVWKVVESGSREGDICGDLCALLEGDCGIPKADGPDAYHQHINLLPRDLPRDPVHHHQ